MDDQLAEMIRDRFNKVDADNAQLLEDLKDHAGKDAIYWQKVDAHYAQLALVKWLAGTSIGSAIMLWIYQHFTKHQ
jgi:hypothetical protein